MCIILYDERITRYRRMQDISILLDASPTYDLCAEMVECDILQLQAHKELCSYNDSHCFVEVHPLVKSQSRVTEIKKELIQLRKENPDAFFKEIANVTQNIRRIESNIRQKKYSSAAVLESWKNNLQTTRLKQTIITKLLNENDT